jgi:hypothetical protein
MGERLWPTFADVNQLESALVNLCSTVKSAKYRLSGSTPVDAMQSTQNALGCNLAVGSSMSKLMHGGLARRALTK